MLLAGVTVNFCIKVTRQHCNIICCEFAFFELCWLCIKFQGSFINSPSLLFAEAGYFSRWTVVYDCSFFSVSSLTSPSPATASCKSPSGRSNFAQERMKPVWVPWRGLASAITDMFCFLQLCGFWCDLLESDDTTQPLLLNYVF